MIKALARGKDGGVLMVLGLSEENVRRLKTAQPIYFDPAALKFRQGEEIRGITIFYGATDADLADTLRTLIGTETEVVVVPQGDARPQWMVFRVHYATRGGHVHLRLFVASAPNQTYAFSGELTFTVDQWRKGESRRRALALAGVTFVAATTDAPGPFGPTAVRGHDRVTTNDRRRRLFDKDGAAEYLMVSVDTVERLIHAGAVPIVKLPVERGSNNRGQVGVSRRVLI